MATADLPKPDARGVFAQREFRALWLAQFVSVFGDFLAVFAVISLITFRWHGTAAQVTYLLIAYMLPLAVVGPISGVFVDRWPVKKVMIASDLIRGALVLLLLWVTNLGQLCAIFVALAVVSSFFGPAQSVALRTLVPKEKLLAANAMMSQAFYAVRLLSPVVAGALVAWLTEKSCFYFDAFSFFFSAAMISTLLIQREPSPASNSIKGFWEQLTSGNRFIFTHPSLAFVITSMVSAMFVMSCLSPLFSIYVRDILRSGVFMYGIVSSAVGVGLIAGSAVVSRFGRSPEQVRGKELDARTDLFSFGVVIYEMLTGTTAFQGETTGVIFDDILNREPTPAVRINPKVPAKLEEIVSKCLEKDRELRYHHASDLGTDLKRLLRELESGSSRGAAVETASKPMWRSKALFAIAAVLIVVIGLAAYRFGRHSSTATLTASERTMLAVLPFENLSGDSNEDYFADGLTEEMIAQLGQLQPKKLGVIARTSAMRYKNTKETAAQIGRELGVNYLLEGSVRQSGQRVRITAQLIQASDQTHLWAESYENPLTDILSVQREIAERITRALRFELLPTQATENPASHFNHEAYNKYLLGLNEFRKGTRDSGFKAIQYFQEAIAADPNNARVYSALSEAYLVMSTYYSSPAEVLPKSKEAALRALELDPSLASAHALLGNLNLFFDWDWNAAEKEFRKALEINPSLPEAHLGYANYLATLGRFDEAISNVHEAYALDPISPAGRHDGFGFISSQDVIPRQSNNAGKQRNWSHSRAFHMRCLRSHTRTWGIEPRRFVRPIARHS